jgi:NAD dependent epimerase/dehydratase
MSELEGRPVLVTGAGGFIGGHLTAALVRAGARVRAFVRYNSRNDRGTLDWFDSEILAGLEVMLGDLRDVESVDRAMKGTELVFHLGAQIAIPYSCVNPRDFFETNVLGSLNVAQTALARDIKHVIHASTSEVYGSAQTVPITEQHPLEAQSPYAASKIGADKLMDSYHRTYGLPATVVRPFNTYGPHQSARAIIPTVISQALASDTVRLGSLEPRRDLTYVSDTVAGFMAAATHPATIGRTIQLGTGVEVSVGEIVDSVGEILGKRLTAQHDLRRVRPATSDVQRLISNPALAAELIGWRPQVSFRVGLSGTMQWVAANADRYRITEYVV